MAASLIVERINLRRMGPRRSSLCSLELLCACCACTLHTVPVLTTGQLGASCTPPSTAPAWL
eukprot:scaffold53428_cov19-Tisochrysis_lutea.AAC.1